MLRRAVSPRATAGVRSFFSTPAKRRVGIVGYGAVGRYLARMVQEDAVCKERCVQVCARRWKRDPALAAAVRSARVLF